MPLAAPGARHHPRHASVVFGLLVCLPSSLSGTQVIDSLTSGGGRAASVAQSKSVGKAPVIDGRLTDSVWLEAGAISGFIQRELHEGQPVTERTEVRIITDGQALYVGAALYDTDPGGIIPGAQVRDGDITKSDYFGILLDTYRDRQNGFVFTTTPAAIEYDAQVVNEGEGGGVQVPGQTAAMAGAMGGFNVNWDGTWTVATSVDSAGWYAEFRIPFTTLRFGPGDTQTWGLNLVRSIRRKSEEAFWSFIPRQFSLMKISRAGTLEGVQVPTRRVTYLTPYALTGVERNYLVDPEARSRSEFGVDLKVGVTQALTLDLTYNTDFAQVEVDEQRTNLTRFPLFFPEKRPFFLENAGIFSAGTPQAVDLFFTRRIGIDSIGRPVPIVGGGRITGRVSSLTVGGLQIFTEDQSYSVLRIGRELATRSRIGVIGVQRISTEDSRNFNTVAGVDGRIGMGDAWTVDWWGAASASTGPDSDVVAYSARLGYETKRWSNVARYIEVGSDFDPQVGFLNRSGGYRYYEAGLMFKHRFPGVPWLKEWLPHANYRGYYGLDGFWQEGRLHLDLTEFDLANGGRFGPEVNVEHQGLEVPFEISPGVTLPPGSYDFTSAAFDLATNPSAPFWLTLRSEVGGFYSGTRAGGVISVGARSGSFFNTSVTTEYNDVRLVEGDFIRKLINTRVAFFFTPRVMFQTLVQYSNQVQAWSVNARFSWLSTAGNGLFVVFNEGRSADSFFSLNEPYARSLIVKYSRQFGRAN